MSARSALAARLGPALDAILAQIRNDPRYQDPNAQRWRDLVFAHLEARSLEGGPKLVAQMTEEEKTQLIAQRLMGEITDQPQRASVRFLRSFISFAHFVPTL